MTGLTQAFASKNVLGTNGSSLLVTGYIVNDGDNGNDYTVTTQNASGTITPAPLTITAVIDIKAYNGTTSSSMSPTYGGLKHGDTATGLTQAFASKNVLGTNGSTLVVTGYTINDGDDGNDYTVTTQNASGTITPAPLTISATSDTKVYDGTTTSSETPTYSALYGRDTVSGLTQAFTSKNVLGNNGNTLMVTGYVVNDGDDGQDYAVTLMAASGTITPAALTISATSETKVYDGTTAASQVPTYQVGGEPLNTLYDGDTVTGLSEVFTSKNVLGTNGSTLTVVSGYSVNDGNDGQDYVVTLMSASGTINPGPPSMLVIQTQPSSTATAGQAFTVQPVIYVEDSNGNLETEDNTTVVSVALASGNGLPEGTTSVTVKGGIATFMGLNEITAGPIAL